MRWHQLDHMQTVCTSLQTDNHASTPLLSFFCPSCCPANSIKALKAPTTTRYSGMICLKTIDNEGGWSNWLECRWSVQFHECFCRVCRMHGIAAVTQCEFLSLCHNVEAQGIFSLKTARGDTRSTKVLTHLHLCAVVVWHMNCLLHVWLCRFFHSSFMLASFSVLPVFLVCKTRKCHGVSGNLMGKCQGVSGNLMGEIIINRFV